MFKRILVAVDGSPTANRGLKTALALAAEQGATLYALHVIDRATIAAGAVGMEYTPASYIEGVWQGLRDIGQKVLNRAEATARKQEQTIVPVLIETGGRGVADAIVMEARKLKVDLIVLGTHGRRGIRRLVMGSDAEGVLRKAKAPVLLVRSSGPGSAPRGRHKGTASEQPKLETTVARRGAPTAVH